MIKRPVAIVEKKRTLFESKKPKILSLLVYCEVKKAIKVVLSNVLPNQNQNRNVFIVVVIISLLIVKILENMMLDGKDAT